METKNPFYNTVYIKYHPSKHGVNVYCLKAMWPIFVPMDMWINANDEILEEIATALLEAMFGYGIPIT